jgi:hypothetical protein
MTEKPARYRGPHRIRRCLICSWPGKHGPSATLNGYRPHAYDPGERRTDPRRKDRMAPGLRPRTRSQSKPEPDPEPEPRTETE